MRRWCCKWLIGMIPGVPVAFATFMGCLSFVQINMHDQHLESIAVVSGIAAYAVTTISLIKLIDAIDADTSQHIFDAMNPQPIEGA